MTSKYLQKAKKMVQKDRQLRQQVLEQEHNFFAENSKCFGKEINKILRSFKIPPHFEESLKSCEHPVDDDPNMRGVLCNLKSLFDDGNFFVLPSFYQLLIFLQKINKRFVLLFRTFGQDFEMVMRELSQWNN